MPTFPLNFMREFDYRQEERLGMLCGGAEPTPKQKRLAREEAAEAVRVFREILALLETWGAFEE